MLVASADNINGLDLFRKVVFFAGATRVGIVDFQNRWLACGGAVILHQRLHEVVGEGHVGGIFPQQINLVQAQQSTGYLIHKQDVAVLVKANNTVGHNLNQGVNPFFLEQNTGQIRVFVFV